MEYKSRIDTIQTIEPISNREELNIIVKGHEDIRINKDGNIVSKWNMNNIKDTYSTEYKMSLTKESWKRMYELVTIIDTEKVKMNRIDIATDININFIENIKMLDLLHKCLTVNFKGGKTWSNITDEDLKISNLRFKNLDWNIEFYDKKKESENKHLYDTRLEIRALRVKAQNFEFHVDKCMDLYNATTENIVKVEKIMSERLIKIWEEEISEQPKLKFTTFVFKYSHYFYTMNILKEVYKTVGLKGTINGWLRDFRKTYTLDLYTKTDVEKMCKKIVKSLKEYKKS